MTGVEAALPDVAGGVLEFLAFARGGDASGGASETGGVAEVCALALSCDQTPANMRLRARSVTLLIGILQTDLFNDRQHGFAEPRHVEDYQDSYGRSGAVSYSGCRILEVSMVCVEPSFGRNFAT